MENEINTGGPAFPQSDLSAYGMGPSQTCNEGMTLRDWFAGQIIGHIYTRSNNLPSIDAKEAYQIADEMVKAREAKP
jgi:CobQ-like glutamine amidotransferase family enzyme